MAVLVTSQNVTPSFFRGLERVLFHPQPSGGWSGSVATFFISSSSALTPSLVRRFLSCCPLAKVEATNSQGRRIGIGAEPKEHSEKERAMAPSEVICRSNSHYEERGCVRTTSRSPLAFVNL